MFRLEKVLWLTMLGSGFLIFLSACGNHKNDSSRAIESDTFQSQAEFLAPRKIKDSFVLPNNGLYLSTQSSDPNYFILDQEASDQEQAQKPTHQAPHSFVPPHHPEGLQTLGIRKASLDKEFLLRTNLIQGGLAPDFHNLKSRVVAFTLKSGRLFLVEATQGHAYYHDLPQQLILTDFKIDHEDEDTIYFNFNSGMSKLYTLEDWYAQDFSGSDPVHFSEQFEAVNIANSYSETVSFNEDKEYLFVRQIAQVQESSAYLPVEVRYYFQPYEPSEDFEPTVSPKNKKHYGFFEINPSISQETKKSRTYASKFNINKPIVFSISHNTPAEYRDTIKEGVLYWNKALGGDFIKVIDAPKGITAPQYDYNMVQWIDWDDASHAYADAQMDPRTGEILNVQIYMSSVFAIKGKDQARQAIRKLLAEHSGETKTSDRKHIEKLLNEGKKAELRSYLRNLSHKASQSKKVGLKGFFQEPMCNHSHLESLALSMAELVGDDLPDDVFFEVSKDHLRDAIAHEVGHTLGLRHNFAGSQASNYSLDQRDEIFEQYVKTLTTPDDLIVTSSIMDYMPFQESAIAGNQVKNREKAFSYDEMAMQILYKGKKLSDFSSKPLFCTDSHTRRYVDCQVWDIGSSPIAYSKYQTEKNLQDFPKMLIEYFISHAKSIEADEEPLPFDHVLMPSIRWSLRLLDPRSRAMAAMISGNRSLRIDREFGYVSEGNSEKIDARFAQWLDEDLQKYGSGKWSNILDAMPENYSEWVVSEFTRLIRSESYREGVGPGGAYSFTDTEIAQMSSAVTEYMEEMEQSLALVDVAQLYLMDNISNQEIIAEGRDLEDSFTEYLSKKARDVIFAQKEIIGEKGPVKEFDFQYLEVFGKAKVEADKQQEFIAKMVIIKSIMEQMEIPSFVVDDEDYTKNYSEEELAQIATENLNALLDKLLSQIDLSQIFPAQSEGENSAAAIVEDNDEDQDSIGSEPMDVDVELGLDQSALDLIARNSDSSLFNRSPQKLPSSIRAMLEQTIEEQASSLKTNRVQNMIPFDRPEEDSSELGTNLTLTNGESQDSTEPEENGDPKAFSIEVPVALYFPVALPKFKYKFETRFWASQLLDSSKGESMAFGMKDRDKLGNEFSSFYNHYLRGFKIKGKTLSRQQKLVNNWIQMNDKVLANLSDTNLLSSLLGL